MEQMDTVYTYVTVFIVVVSALHYIYKRPPNVQRRRESRRERARREPFVMPEWARQQQPPPTLTAEQLASLHQRKPPHIWNNILIFSDALRDSSAQRANGYLQDAEIGIKICVHKGWDLSSTFWDLISAKCIQGVQVRCVSGYHKSNKNCKEGMQNLIQNGISVRLDMGGRRTYNDFIVIDNEAVIIGSLNWAGREMTTNIENLMISIDPPIVKKYRDEFERLFLSSETLTKIEWLMT